MAFIVSPVDFKKERSFDFMVTSQNVNMLKGKTLLQGKISI